MWLPFSSKKVRKTVPVNSVTGEDAVFERSLSKLMTNVSVSESHVDALYRPVLQNTYDQFKLIGLEDKYSRVIDILDEMLRYRRGCTLPEGVIAEQVQRYREITNYTLVTTVLGRTLGELNSNHCLQYDVAGTVRSYPPLLARTQRMEDSAFIGVSQGTNVTVGKGAEDGLAFWSICYLFQSTKNSVAMDWFAEFPDMLNKLFKLVLGGDSGIMGEIVEAYTNRTISIVTSSENVSRAEDSVTSTRNDSPSVSEAASQGVGTLFQNVERANAAEAHPSPTAKPTDAMNGLLGMLDKETKSTPEPESEQKNEGASVDVVENGHGSLSSPLEAMLANLASAEESKGTDESESNSTKAFSDTQTTLFESYLVSLSEHHEELSMGKLDETEYLIVAMNIHRDVTSRVFRHLKGERKRGAQKSLMEHLATVVNEKCSKDGRVIPFVTEAGDKVLLLQVSCYIDVVNRSVERYISIE
jgi:hypothetical protein